MVRATTFTLLTLLAHSLAATASAAAAALPKWKPSDALAHGDGPVVDLNDVAAQAWFNASAAAGLESASWAASGDLQRVVTVAPGLAWRPCAEVRLQVMERATATGALEPLAVLRVPAAEGEPVGGCGQLALALDARGGTVALGVNRLDAVFVFEEDQGGVWALRQTLRAGASELPPLSNATLAAAAAGAPNPGATEALAELAGLARSNGLGWALSLDGGRLAVGAPGLADPAESVRFGVASPVAHGYWYGDKPLGRVLVFERIEGTDGQWQLASEIAPPALADLAAAELLEATWVRANATNLAAADEDVRRAVGSAASGQVSHHFGAGVRLAYPFLAVQEPSLPDLEGRVRAPKLHLFEASADGAWAPVHEVEAADVAALTLAPSGEAVFAASSPPEAAVAPLFHLRRGQAGEWQQRPLSLKGVPADAAEIYAVPALAGDRLALGTARGIFLLARSENEAAEWRVERLLTVLEPIEPRETDRGLRFHERISSAGVYEPFALANVALGADAVLADADNFLFTFDLTQQVPSGSSGVVGGAVCGALGGAAVLAALVTRGHPGALVALGLAQILAFVWASTLLTSDAADVLSTYERARADGVLAGHWGVFAAVLLVNLLGFFVAHEPGTPPHMWLRRHQSSIAWIVPCFMLAPAAAAQLLGCGRPAWLDAPRAKPFSQGMLQALTSALVLLWVWWIVQFPQVVIGTGIWPQGFSVLGVTAGPLLPVLMALASTNLAVGVLTAAVVVWQGQKGRPDPEVQLKSGVAPEI